MKKEINRIFNEFKQTMDQFDDFEDTKPINGYKRTRFGNEERISEHYKGWGPKKTIPNIPKTRLKNYLLSHGLDEQDFSKTYMMINKEDPEIITTHDLIKNGLINRDDYLESLGKIPKGKRF